MSADTKVHFLKVPLSRYKGRLDQLTTACGITVFAGSASDGESLVEQTLRGTVTISDVQVALEYEGETVTCKNCRRASVFRGARRSDKWLRGKKR